LSPQQDAFALEVEAGEQQDRLLAPGWQHDFAAGVGVATRSCCGAGGGLAGAAQAQAWAGATAPITVETVSRRQTNDRTRHRVGIRASYTRLFVAVNSIRPSNE
jgi:nicotinamide mononucleotide (NMN) deamidase PncC